VLARRRQRHPARRASAVFLSRGRPALRLPERLTHDTLTPSLPPQVDTEDQTVIDYYAAWIKQLVADYSIDGLRIDTVKHVRKDFWPQFAEAAGVYAVGEVLDGSVDYLTPYTEVMDGILSYAVYYQNLYAFQNTGGSMATLANTYLDMASKSKDNTLLGTFTEVHDLPRAASLIKDQMLLANHAAWPFVVDGIPIAYYGQEQGFSGGDDPVRFPLARPDLPRCVAILR